MPATAIALPDSDVPAQRPAKRMRISPRIQEAIRLIATGTVKTQRAAAERVGMSETHLCTMLARPQIQALIARKASETIRTAKLRASHRLVELIDANSEHVAAQVSERILTSEGILKSDQHAIAVNVDVKAGFILDLREEPHRTIEHVPSVTDVE
jgi:alkylated DNA nucleotide flippase Atl1